MQLPFREWTLFCGISLGGGRNASARSGIPKRIDKLEIIDSKYLFAIVVGSTLVSCCMLLCSVGKIRRNCRSGMGRHSVELLWVGGHNASARRGSRKE